MPRRNQEKRRGTVWRRPSGGRVDGDTERTSVGGDRRDDRVGRRVDDGDGSAGSDGSTAGSAAVRDVDTGSRPIDGDALRLLADADRIPDGIGRRLDDR